MRILQIIETGGPGGAETVYAALASGLRNRGHAIHCLVGNGNWLPAELRRRGFKPTLRANGGSFDVALLRQIGSLVRQHDIELIHAHLFDAAVYASVAATWCGVPCLTTLHGQVDLKRSGTGQRIKALALRFGSKTVVAVSRALRADLQPYLRIPAHRFQVVYNGVEWHSTGAATNDLIIHDRKESETFRLVALGNIRPAKDYPNLLRAIARLTQNGRQVHLDVVGQPDSQGLYESLHTLIDQLRIEPRVTFHGFVANPGLLLRNAHAFVLASSREGFSLATIEAMLEGTPVVATRSGGPEEILTDGQTGLLVPAGNSDVLAAAIERLIDDPNLSRNLAYAARESARKRFSLDAMLDGYEALYQTISVG